MTDKEQIVLKMQSKVEAYFAKKNTYWDDERKLDALRQAIWLVVQKEYSIAGASKVMGRKFRVQPRTLTNILVNNVFPADMRAFIKKRNQVKDFNRILGRRRN